MRKTFGFPSIISILFSVMVFGSCHGNTESIDKPVTCLKDLDGRTVCVLTGSIQDLAVSSKNPDINILRIEQVSEMFTAVESGNSEFLLMDSASLINVDLDRRGLEYNFSLSELAGEICVGFGKENTKLCQQFNRFLKKINANGTLQNLKDRWLGAQAETEPVPTQETSLNGEPLVVGTSVFYPFTFIKEGELSGFEVEMMMKFGESIGRPVVFQNLYFSSLIAALNTNKIDAICALMTKTEERSKQVLFSDPYYYGVSACVGRKEGFDGGLQKTSLRERIYVNIIHENRWKMIVDGLCETVIIAFFSIIFGSFIGALVCWMRKSRRRAISGFAMVYVEIMRGIPLLVFLMIMFYVIFSSSSISARWVAIIAFSMNFGAYVSEIFRTGIDSIDKGQWEAGLAMGFRRFQTFRYFIVQQSLKQIIPVFKGEAISLIKNTSIVGYIAIQDLTKVSDIIRSRTFDAFFPLIVITIIYFILAWIIGKVLDLAARRIK